VAHSPPLEPSISGKLAGASADRTPLPEVIRGTDSRVLDAWCEWLGALATDAERRDRITLAMGPEQIEATPRAAVQALSARLPDGVRIATVIVPLYLDFVQVLACAYRPEHGFSWVRHDPIVDAKHAPRPGDLLDGAILERTPLKALIDELSHAVLSQRRGGREMPEALRVFADLFGPNIGGSTPPPPSAP
jgi:hypothetical protein